MNRGMQSLVDSLTRFVNCVIELADTGKGYSGSVCLPGKTNSVDAQRGG